MKPQQLNCAIRERLDFDRSAIVDLQLFTDKCFRGWHKRYLLRSPMTIPFFTWPIQFSMGLISTSEFCWNLQIEFRLPIGRGKSTTSFAWLVFILRDFVLGNINWRINVGKCILLFNSIPFNGLRWKKAAWNELTFLINSARMENNPLVINFQLGQFQKCAHKRRNLIIVFFSFFLEIYVDVWIFNSQL